MRAPYREQMDERMERYVVQRLSARLKNHMDTQNLQSARKGKVRLLSILIVFAAFVAFLLVLSQVF